MTTRPFPARLRALMLGAPLVLATAGLPEAVPAAVTVDCSKPGQTIGKKLTGTAKVLEIVVKGHCVENLEIDRDDVTIMTSGSPASITAADPTRPTIMLDGAHRIVIDGVVPGGLTISGGSGGVTASRGSTVDLIDCVVQGSTGNGVTSAYGSTVSIDACTVQNHGGTGVVAANAASLAITNSTVTGNTGSGIVAIRSSDVRVGQNLSGTALGPVTVSNSGSTGFSVTENSAGILLSSTIANNGTGGGVFVGRGSGAMIGMSSTGQVSGNTITGNQGIGLNVEGGQATVMANEISNNARFGIHLGDGGNGRIGVVSSTQPYLKNTITGNGSNGIHVRGGSVSIGGNDIIGNGTNAADSGRNGINVTGGHAYIPGGNTISGHPAFGVVVSAAGNALIGDGNLGAGISSINTISGNGTNGALSPGSRGGILLFRGGVASLVNADVSGNSGTGVMASLNSSLEVSSSTVKTSSGDGIWLSGHSYMRMRSPAVVDGSGGSGIRLGRDAGAEFFGYVGAPPRVTNNATGLNCEDTESSVWAEGNDFGFVSGNAAQNVMGNCTGF